MKITAISSLFVLIGCAFALERDHVEERHLYEEFKRKHGKPMGNDDLEFSSIYANARIPKRIKAQRLTYQPSTGLPTEMDWRTKGAVGPVLRQGSCGSCWAFSVIGNVEGQWFKKTGNLVPLSQQQLVDCDDQDHGCHGGYPPTTFEAIKEMGGLMKESDYEYKGVEGKCLQDSAKFVAYVNSSIVLEVDEAIQASYLFENGPLSSALNGDPLQFYHRGVMHPRSWHCPVDGMNHAVLTVGYGVEGQTPYWIIRNSWGRSFGEKGYFRIYRGDGTCGINQVVSSAIIN